MIVLSTMLLVLAALLILPGWLWFRRAHTQSVWLLLLPAFGIGLWVALTAVGIGPQSLSNFVEVLGVVLVAVIMPYVKFLAMDRSSVLESRGAIVSYMVVAAVALGLRLFMPSLPE